MIEFKDVWTKFFAHPAGAYRYGREALDNVAFGWRIAVEHVVKPKQELIYTLQDRIRNQKREINHLHKVLNRRNHGKTPGSKRA